MSDIVNVGLQQGGIEESAPRVLSAKGMQLLTPFVDETDRTALSDGYTTENFSYKLQEEFPDVVPGEVYVLSGEKEKREAAEEAYSHASAAMLRFFQSIAQQNGEELNLSDSDASASMDFDAIYEMLPTILQMPEQSFSEAID